MWESIVSGLVSGVVAGLTVSAIWAGVVAWWNWQRNRNLEKSLRRALTPKAVSMHADGSVGIVITNPTDYQVTIREAIIVGGERGAVHLAFRRDSPKGAIHEEGRGWVELPAHTDGIWSFNILTFGQRNIPHVDAFKKSVTPVTGFSVAVEYKTLLGKTKVIHIEPDNPADRTNITSSFERYFKGEVPFAR